MPNYNPDTLTSLANMRFGARVDYRLYAATALPATTTLDLWTVTGIVAVTLIVGEVTTVIQTQACNTKFIAHPATGTDVDICANLDITAMEVGAKLVPIGTLATALQKGNAGAVQGMNVTPIIVGNSTYATTIRLNTAATNTGALKWALWYVPLTDAANVVTA